MATVTVTDYVGLRCTVRPFFSALRKSQWTVITGLIVTWTLLLTGPALAVGGGDLAAQKVLPSTEQTLAVRVTSGTLAPICTNCSNSSGKNHVWMRPISSAQTNGYLFVFLGGAGNSPEQFENILMVAADVGYHAVALSYETNGLSQNLQAKCLEYIDEEDAQNCYKEGRERAASCKEGLHASAGNDFYTCACGDDVKNRLRTFLTGINTADPLGNWSVFSNLSLFGYQPGKIVLAGFSGGAGVAQHLSKTAQFHAVVMMDGVADAYNLTPNVIPQLLLFQPA